MAFLLLIIPHCKNKMKPGFVVNVLPFGVNSCAINISRPFELQSFLCKINTLSNDFNEMCNTDIMEVKWNQL